MILWHTFCVVEAWPLCRIDKFMLRAFGSTKPQCHPLATAERRTIIIIQFGSNKSNEALFHLHCRTGTIFYNRQHLPWRLKLKASSFPPSTNGGGGVFLKECGTDELQLLVFCDVCSVIKLFRRFPNPK